MWRLWLIFILPFVVSFPQAFAQSASPATTSFEGLDLLRQVGEHYSGAKSYYIEAAEQTIDTGVYEHSVRKAIKVAAEAPGNRFYFEGRSSMGSSLTASDGKTVWTYHLDEHRYTEKPFVGGWNNQQGAIAVSEMPRMNAEHLRSGLANLARDLKSAERLPDRSLRIHGKKIACQLVRVRSSDEKRTRGSSSFDRTIWIDKADKTVVQITEHSQTYRTAGTARIPMKQEIDTAYETTELDEPAREALFNFTPPAGSHQIADFPDPMDSYFGSLVGETIPSLKLKRADGRVTSIEALRGKPVLLDFWATWCGPCVASMPQLSRIYEEAKAQGLVLLSVDQDEEAKTANDFLAKKGYSWPDFHDGDGEIEKLLGNTGVPRTMLIDSKGRVVFDATGMNEDKLRSAIVKLGPEYSALAPKPKQAPCVASN